MRAGHLQVHFERVPAAVGAVLFGVGAYVFLDAAVLGNIPIDMDQKWLWAIFALCAITLSACLKNSVFPCLIFSADSPGIKIGRGIFINKIHFVAWDKLVRIEEGTIEITIHNQDRPNLHKEIPAMKLVFDESIDLGNVGYDRACPEEKSNYLIAAKLFRRPLPDTIADMMEMKERYTKH